MSAVSLGLLRPLTRCHGNAGRHAARILSRQQRRSCQSNTQPQKSVIFSDSNARQASLTPAEKVIEGGKDFGYSLVVVAGVAVTGGILYAIGRELFSSQSTAALHSLGVDRCLNDIQVQSVLGEPIKSYGEASHRRRRHVQQEEFVDDDGTNMVAMKFYLEGPYNKADVYLQGYKTDEKRWKIKYLVLETQRYPKRTIVLERPDKAPAAAPKPIR